MSNSTLVGRNGASKCSAYSTFSLEFLNGLVYFFHAKIRINVNSTLIIDRTTITCFN